MKNTFFFYDLETSGLNPRFSRVMQFAGIRTDLDFKQIGESVNILVKLPEDVLPSPSAIAVTGITPQSTLSDGLSEAEFAKFLIEEIFTPGTIAVGYNSIRFDDEFIRNVLWRNFYDPYEWQWSEKRSKWDLLDVVRIVRALRPEGIKWSFIEKDGVKIAANKLELLAKENKLEHVKAHDALSDVEALIGVTKLIKEKQPKMYDFLFENRGKKEIAKLVNLDDPKPFVYVSGRYSLEHEKATVAFPVAPGKNPGTVLVYDLLFDPLDFEKLSGEDMKKRLKLSWKELQEKKIEKLPIKELNYGRCPAVAPLGVLDEKAQKNTGISLDLIKKNYASLLKNKGIIDKMIDAWRDRPDYAASPDVEGKLYDSFTPEGDKMRVKKIPSLKPEELADFHPLFTDERLPELLFRYKARNFPQSLTESEQEKWQKFRIEKFNSQIKSFMNELELMKKQSKDDFLISELKLYAESIFPEEG